jgi:hypothetical protein
MPSFIIDQKHSFQVCSNCYAVDVIRVLTIFFIIYLVTACANGRQVSVIDASIRSDVEADVSLVKMPETDDLFGQVGKTYSINADNQSASVRIPFEAAYELGNFGPASLFIAKYSAKLKRFTPLESQVNLKEGFVSAQYNGSGTYTLFGGVVGGIDYDVGARCGLDLGSLDIGTDIVRERICPVILCPNFADERHIDFDSMQSFGGGFPLPGPSGGAFPRGNLCDICLGSFGGGRPTICEPRPGPRCIPDKVPPLATAELTQRGAFSGETCFVSAKTSLIKVAAEQLASERTGDELSDIRLEIYEGDSKCGELRGTVTGFTYDTDNVTKLESVPLTENVYFIVPGSMLNNQGNYKFRVSGSQGSDTFAGDIAAQWFKRGGDLTIVAAPIEDDLDPVTELPGVLADFDHLGRVFPVRDGTNPSILSPASSSATGVMFFIAAPIPLAGFSGGTNALRDDYNDSNTFDARLSAAFLSEADRIALGFGGAGAAAVCGTSTWNRNVGRDNDVLLQEIAHNLCQIEADSPNSRPTDQFHSTNNLLGTEGYNLLDEARVGATRARSIMWPTEFSIKSRAFYEAFEWEKTCKRMTTNDYVGFQSPTGIEAANELGDKWPTSFSMIGSFDSNGSVRIIRSYMTNAPRSEYVASKSDYHVVFSDSAGQEIVRKPLAISRVSEHYEDKDSSKPGSHVHSKQHLLVKDDFTFVSRMPPNTTQVAIVKDKEVMAKIDKSHFAPQIKEFNVEKSKARELIFNWNIDDKDSEELSASILVSKDDGESFQPVASNRKGKTLRWNPQFMAGGIPLFFQLKVTDGFHVTKQYYEQKIVLEDKMPFVSIFSPQNNEEIQPGQPFTIRGTAWDAEEGNLEDGNIVWTLDGKKITTGRKGVVPGLKPGKHKIGITGTDSKQQQRIFR